ncbi:hypothetical protein BD410DRAFT_810130 [Rickenella mellea]|uniref:Uncharacterized protein n=1 Tax=Rickenella mellea TaxID=50990 RepID=A0A4Y7PFW4_9AGAM|nr:hypothetical protein BD410DRAFT_810130 [Rickenella mellea]
MPVNSPAAIEGMTQDLTDPTPVNQGTLDPIESANSPFLPYPSTTTTNKPKFHPPGQAPINNFQNQGEIAGHFIPATTGDDAPTYGGGSSDGQGTLQRNRILNDLLEPPSSVPDLAPLELRGTLGRLFQPLVATQCNQWHIGYMNAQMGGAQASPLDHYNTFNIEAPLTVFPGLFFCGFPDATSFIFHLLLFPTSSWSLQIIRLLRSHWNKTEVTAMSTGGPEAS